MSQETQTRYALHKEFRYLHEPIADGLSDQRVVGRSSFAHELADRIVLSRGGAFLVSGLRGVGKTTCVRLAMHSIRADRSRYAALDGAFELVDVWLNLARPLEPVQLLHHLIRHLYLRLKEMHLLHRLDPELQKDLNTAFLRTSFEISSRSLTGEERGRASEVGFGKAPWLGIEFLGKISSSYKQTHSDEEALKYLPYDEKAAEFEILNFSRRLLNGIEPNLSFFQRLLKGLGRIYPAVPRVRVVFILDELDKLDYASDPKSGSSLDPILQSLKTVFAASSFSFVFIGGKEVEERLLEDASHGDSIYESIFAYDLYLPCLWNEQDQILDSCFALTSPKERAHANTIALYLRYKGRGVPRRTWRELNRHVRWDRDIPSITLDLEHRRYMQVFAKLEDALQQDDLFKLSGRTIDDARRDRQRLSFYYTADWIFSRGRDIFTEAEVVRSASTLNLGGALNPAAAEQIAQNTLLLLLSRAFIERADQDLTRISPSDSSNRYKLSPWVLLAFQGSQQQQWTPDETVAIERNAKNLQIKKIGAYDIVGKLGSGGFSEVYKVRSPAGRLWAAKLLRAELGSSEPVAALFRREAEVLNQISHPGVVAFHGSGEQDGRPYILMDLIEGVSLRTLLDSLKTMDVPVACRIASEIAEVCDYIHLRNFVRLDIKPANVFITDAGKVKLIDLGIIKNKTAANTADTSTGMTIGTFGYMAPEQIKGQNIDARSDIYSLAVVLFEMLAGQTPFPAASEAERLQSVVTQQAPSLLNFVSAPQPLADAIAKGLSGDPDQRFPAMSDFQAAVAPFAAKTLDPVLLALKSRMASRESSRTDTVVLPSTATTVHGMPPTISFAPPPPAPVVPPAPAPAKASGHPAPGTVAKVSGPRAPAKSSAPPHAPAPVMASGPPTTISAPPPRFQPPPIVPSPKKAASSDLMDQLLRELAIGTAGDQELAFKNLWALTGNVHLLFDFAGNICLWGGPGAHQRKISLGMSSRLILGRNAAAVDLALDDPAVSRQHIAFFPSSDGSESFIAEDLSSAAGTLLNGERLRRRTLTDGDVIQVGSRKIRIHLLSRDRTRASAA